MEKRWIVLKVVLFCFLAAEGHFATAHSAVQTNKVHGAPRIRDVVSRAIAHLQNTLAKNENNDNNYDTVLTQFLELATTTTTTTTTTDIRQQLNDTVDTVLVLVVMVVFVISVFVPAVRNALFLRRATCLSEDTWTSPVLGSFAPPSLGLFMRHIEIEATDEIPHFQAGYLVFVKLGKHANTNTDVVSGGGDNSGGKGASSKANQNVQEGPSFELYPVSKLDLEADENLHLVRSPDMVLGVVMSRFDSGSVVDGYLNSGDIVIGLNCNDLPKAEITKTATGMIDVSSFDDMASEIAERDRAIAFTTLSVTKGHCWEMATEPSMHLKLVASASEDECDTTFHVKRMKIAKDLQAKRDRASLTAQAATKTTPLTTTQSTETTTAKSATKPTTPNTKAKKSIKQN